MGTQAMFAGEYVPDAERRSCYDCYWCQAHVSWWCKNPKVHEKYNVRIPGYAKCEFWRAAQRYEDLTRWQRVKHFVGLGVDYIVFDKEGM